MNNLEFVSADDLIYRRNSLAKEYKEKIEMLSNLLNNIQKIYDEIVIINSELQHRNVETDNSCPSEPKKTSEIHQEPSLD